MKKDFLNELSNFGGYSYPPTLFGDVGGGAEPEEPPVTPPPKPDPKPDGSTKPLDTAKDPNMGNVTNLSKNPGMTYAGTQVQDVSKEDEALLAAKMARFADTRVLEKMPPGYYDNSIKAHRASVVPFLLDGGKTRDESEHSSDAEKIFRLGDCYFVIPPEFISVTTNTTHDSIQGIRSSSSIHTKHGYVRREIHVSLVLNGMSQINGHEVESPFSYKYFMDGLRPLISQFKFTPFLPIENLVINQIHGIYNVALRGISVETLPGFPETLNVTLTMQEFNIEPYCAMPNDWFNDCIDWDLFRWYVQKPLTGQSVIDLKKITTPNLTHKFKFKLLSADAIGESRKNTGENVGTIIHDDELLVDITDDSKYVELVSSDEDIILTQLSFGMSNIVPLIQLSHHESPTMQYLGCSDTSFSFNFETRDPSLAAKFDQLNRENLDIVRNNRFTNGIGFIKIENELVELTGTKFLIMENITTNTVPGFPGLYSVSVRCLSYDENQLKKEKLIGFKPFATDRDGTRDDLIDQSDDGMVNKIIQDCMIERRLQEVEMYPDMALPTYREVDAAIVSIRSYRDKHSFLEQLPYDAYPRHVSSIPGSKTDVAYQGYVDPDFYVFYPMSVSELKQSETVSDEISGMHNTRNVRMNSEMFSKSIGSILEAGSVENILDLFPFPKLVPDIAIEPKFTYGWEGHIRTRVHKSHLDEQNAGGSHPPGEGGANGEYVEGNGTGTGNSKDPSRVHNRYGNPFVDFMCDRADSKCGYVWGADGQVLNSTTLAQFKRTHGAAHYTGSVDCTHWMGRQVFDCSGFISWAMRKVGLKPAGWRVVAASFGSTGTRVSKADLQVGDICYHGTHCAVYIGDGKTVEAKATKIGVVYGKLNSKYSYVRPAGMKAACDKFLANNPDFYLDKPVASPNSIAINEKEAIPSYGISKTRDSEIMVRTPGGSSPGNGGGAGDDEVILADFGGGNPCDKWNSIILQHAAAFNLDPNFIKCIIMIESTGNPNCVSFASSLIVGLMQVHTGYHKVEGGNPLDPSMNVKAGCKVWDNYRKIDYVGTDLERWICAYNAGPGYCRSVYVLGTKSLPKETKNYVAKYKKWYSQLMANGGKAGKRNTPGGTNAPGPSDAGGSSEPSAPAFVYNEGDFVNNNAGKEHGGTVAGVDARQFGADFIEVVATMDSGTDFLGINLQGKHFDFSTNEISEKSKTANAPDKAIEYTTVDHVRYSCKGTLTRAFPSYLFVIVDEQQEWCDGKKLWTNYYVCRSAIDINVFHDYASPSSVAKISLTNFHSNLTQSLRTTSVRDTFDDDGDGVRRAVYELTGAIIDEEITDKMIGFKNELYEEVRLNEGARIHIRLGYSSDPAMYPIVFNGTVTELAEGEVVEIVAQGDGRELISTPVTDKTAATNKDLGLSEEVSNMIAEILIKRENDFLYAFTFGNFKIRSGYGIEHFGQHFFKLNPMNHLQYDLVKNIYKGNYNGVPFCKSPFNMVDGESNFRFMASGKNAWDMFKMCEKAMPDFIAYPRSFGFENRLFYGVPHWLCKYKYNYIDSTGELVEHAKSFSQHHETHSLDSIIENNIKIDTRNHITNAIGVYTLGGDLATTPIVMSDKHIDASRQVTKTFDTTSVQDFSWVPGFIDKLLSWSGMYDNGKNLAIKICVSEIMDSWKNTYSGNILMLGQGEIQPHDNLFIDDMFLSMKGFVSVRQVYHSMNMATGYTTSVTPGLLVHNTLKNSGGTNLVRGAFKVFNAYAHRKGAVKVSMMTYKKVSSMYNAAKSSKYISGATKFTKNFVNGTGKDIFMSVKNGKIVTKFIDTIKASDKIMDGIKLVKGAKVFGKIASAGKMVLAGVTAITPIGWIAIASYVATDLLVNIFFTWVIDMFAYNNTVTLMPLSRKTPSGKILAYVGGTKGSRDLLPVENMEVEPE